MAKSQVHMRAVARFGTDRDAERAVAMMNGQRIDGRVVTVGLYL